MIIYSGEYKRVFMFGDSSSALSRLARNDIHQALWIEKTRKFLTRSLIRIIKINHAHSSEIVNTGHTLKHIGLLCAQGLT